MSTQRFKAHASVRVTTGKRAGMVGTVEQEREATGMVLVRFVGVVNDQPFDETAWVKASQLEHA